MVGRKVITMCHCTRPDYTRRVLQALRSCAGIADYLILPHVDPASEEVRAEIEAIDFAECLPTFNTSRLGVNRNTENALLDGFAFSNFVIHVEDDILLSSDALLYYEWCAEHYRSDPRVFSVTSYNRRAEAADPSEFHQVRLRRWFHPWGWATWRDRWETFSGTLHSSPASWDVLLNVIHCVGGLSSRCHEVYPELSRSQNIGEISSSSNRTVAYYRANHLLKHWAGDVAVPAEAFRE